MNCLFRHIYLQLNISGFSQSLVYFISGSQGMSRMHFVSEIQSLWLVKTIISVPL